MVEGIKNFLKDFFGKGEENYKFRYFSLEHIIPLVIMVIIIILIYRYRHIIRENLELDKKLRTYLSFIVSFVNMSVYWLYINIGVDLTTSLPISICQSIMIFSPFLLLNKSQKLFDIFYFWTLCGSINALITPAILDNYGPTKYRYYQFWIGHTGIFIIIFYCIFVLQMEVNFKSLLTSIKWLLLFSVLAIFANYSIPGANYLFLSGSEKGQSLLDLLPTYLPYRIAILFVLVVILFYIAYLPWYIKERNKNNHLLNNSHEKALLDK
ncbi:MAG TPA: TIGR02206 family membrane protein [Haloplasmataceae bacterium]